VKQNKQSRSDRPHPGPLPFPGEGAGCERSKSNVQFHSVGPVWTGGSNERGENDGIRAFPWKDFPAGGNGGIMVVRFDL